MLNKINDKLIMIVIILSSSLECFFAYHFYSPIDPFPEPEFYNQVSNIIFRNLLIWVTCFFLSHNRKRLPDRIKRYFPVVVIGILYCFCTIFIIKFLQLDYGPLTYFSILVGLNNNIMPVLLIAMCYHQFPNFWWRIIYFCAYFFTTLVLLFDTAYFCNTSTHVEKILFDNLNIYAIGGLLSSLAQWQLAIAIAFVVFFILLFRLSTPTKRKPNFAYSLMIAGIFCLLLNLSNNALVFVSKALQDQIIGLGLEMDLEAIRQEYRGDLTVPVSINFINKLFFEKSKMAYMTKVDLVPLTAEEIDLLAELKVFPAPKEPEPVNHTAYYDRIVVLVLESVHRDYVHFYNKKFPAESTPFLDSLLTSYPHVDNYYTSGIPTTQGTNSLLRSQIIYEGEIPTHQPSLFRLLGDKGYRSIFLSASSKYYSNELIEYPRQFGMSEYYPKEYLEAQGYIGASGWGYHNDVLYKEAVRLLAEGQASDDKMFMWVKTLDMHQPYPYSGLSVNDMPESVRNSAYESVRGMNWVNNCIENFFKELEEKNLLDEKTLVIITSDHNPHSGGEYKELVAPEYSGSIAPLPLIFVAKNLRPFEEMYMSIYASQIDFAPTILDLTGLPNDREFLGKSILRANPEDGFAIGYFGGDAYYHSSTEQRYFSLEMEKLDDPYNNALANWIVYDYARRWHQK